MKLAFLWKLLGMDEGSLSVWCMYEIIVQEWRSGTTVLDTQNMYIALYDEVTYMVRFGLAYQKGRTEEIKGMNLGASSEPLVPPQAMGYYPRRGSSAQRKQSLPQQKQRLKFGTSN